jgi:talin
MATSKAIGAANSLRQEDVIAASNMGRKAVSDLLYICRGSGGDSGASRLENDYQRQVLSVGLNCAIYYKELLENIQLVFGGEASGGGEGGKQSLEACGKSVSSAVADILQIAGVLKERGGCVDEEDATVVAESELLGAADAIESAAKKLSTLQPRAKSVVGFYGFYLILLSGFLNTLLNGFYFG